jgi:hypothetical protein
MKDVIFLEAKRAPKRDRDRKEIPGEFVGVFRRKMGVTEKTPGAVHYKGVIAAQNNKPYEYWAVEADVLRGYIRWVDVQSDKFGTSIALYLESEKFLFRIALDYDVQNLRQVGNYLSGMKKDLEGYYFNITFDAWKDKDGKGGYKLMDSGEPRWTTMVKFGDAKAFVDPKKMREYLDEKGLAWEKSFDAAKNKDVYNQGKEMKFWLMAILGVQKHLLTTSNVLPFTYNSILACEAPHPIGCGNLNEGERATCKAIYEAVKSEYRMPFGREMKDADDVFGGGYSEPQYEEEYIDQANPLPNPSSVLQPSQSGVPFPTEEPGVEEDWTAEPADKDKLPF